MIRFFTVNNFRVQSISQGLHFSMFIDGFGSGMKTFSPDSCNSLRDFGNLWSFIWILWVRFTSTGFSTNHSTSFLETNSTDLSSFLLFSFTIAYNDEMVYEMNHIWTADMKSNEAMIFAVMRAIFCNCVEKPEKFRTSTGFEPVTSRFRCDALTNWAMKPLTLSVATVSGFIAQLVRASHRNREVTGSNPVEVLNFSGFSTQLQKIALITAKIIASFDYRLPHSYISF